MMSAVPPITATLVGTITLSIVYWYIYRQYQEKYIGIWAAGWSIHAVRYVFEIFYKISDSHLFLISSHLMNLISGLFILEGIQNFIGKKTPKSVFYGFFLAVMWIFMGENLTSSPVIYNLPTFAFSGFIYIWTGIIFLRSHKVNGLGKYLSGWGFVIWGIHKFDYPFANLTLWVVSWGYAISAFLELIVATGTLLVYFERIRQGLSMREEKFRKLAENAQDLIYRYKLYPDQGFEYVSPSFAKITGYAPEEFYANPHFIYSIIHPDDRKIAESLNKNRENLNDQQILLRFITKDGTVVWTEHRVVHVFNKEKNSSAIEGIARDVTERKQSEQVLKRFRLLSEQARDVMIFFRKDGTIFDFNNAAIKTYGYTRDELNNMTVFNLNPSEGIEKLSENIAKAKAGGILFESVHKTKNGELFPVEVSLQGFFMEKEPVMFCIIRDISERKKAEETISHLAFHDLLTDLPNRVLFYDRLNSALLSADRNNKKLAVMFLDLDRFKYVNDIMGHAIGDQLLKQVAEVISGCVRANDTVARIGGDEFTILLPDIKREEDAAKVAEKIICALKKPWIINGKEFLITSSIGIAIFPNDGVNADLLTKNADTAMYRAKEQGDNYQFYAPTMNEKAIARMEVERRLRRAINQNEFEVYYQPQIDIKENRVVGFEALLRWNHPEKGTILPADFIAIAEDTGLIVPIGEWVLKTACSQNMAWQKLGMPPSRIAINISACQFRQNNFLETVANVLKETGMDPELLEFEITELTAMHDVETTVNTMRKLREMGVRIAIDDFGTGYSSLSYLRKFPITTLKVDRSFVCDVLSNVEDAAIVATIIVLAQNLRLKVVVEGIETEDQLKFFAQQECFEMQGFLFSKPQPAHIAKNMLSSTCWKAVG